VLCERYACVILLTHVSVFTATNLKLITVTVRLTLPIKPKLDPPTAKISRATVCSGEHALHLKVEDGLIKYNSSTA